MTCQKVPYDTRRAALADIKLIMVQFKYRSKKAAVNKKANKKLHPYQCPRCGAWHITSLKPVKNK